MATQTITTNINEAAEAAAAAAAAKGTGDDEVELEIVDDTPEKDRGRTPLKPEKVAAITAEPTEEELASYSENVQKRIKQMQHAFHDQRRAADAAQRERDAAVEYARAVQEKAKQIEQRYVEGEKTYVSGMQEKAKQGIEAAEAELLAATEQFDAAKIVAAQRKLTSALMEAEKFKNWQAPPSQAEKSVVQLPSIETAPRVTAPEPDSRAKAWLAKNQWFEADKEMTGFAYGVDAKLAAQGISAATNPDAYYAEIDRRLREVFPDRFEGDDQSQRADKRASRQDPPPTTVAPVRRSSSGKRVVTLTRSQEALARKLGISPADYAAEVVKLEQR